MDTKSISAIPTRFAPHGASNRKGARLNTQQDILLHNECQQLQNTDTLSGTSQVAVREDQREISPEKKIDGSVAWENDLEKASSETECRDAGR